MIFRPELVKAILAGKKTQTRRVVKHSEDASRYRAGRSYALQRGRGMRAVARIDITAVRMEMLHAIDEADARNEGFDSRAAFMDYWEALHGNRDDRPVWVLTFTVAAEQEQPLYLARPVPGRRGDYTRIRDQAVDDLPVVDPEQLVDASDLNFMLLSRYIGWEPEDVLAESPQFNTTDDIKRLRRALGQRGLDGLPQPAQAVLDRTLAYMVREGRSVRDIARAMDCSVGHAHKLIRTAATKRDAA
jgi:hypothetical protein